MLHILFQINIFFHINILTFRWDIICFKCLRQITTLEVQNVYKILQSQRFFYLMFTFCQTFWSDKTGLNQRKRKCYKKVVLLFICIK